LKVAIISRSSDAKDAIRQLLLPWKVTFTSLDEADVSIVYGEKPPENTDSIVIPSNCEGFFGWLKKEELEFEREFGKRICVSATKETILSLVPLTYYRYNGSFERVSGQPSFIKLGNGRLLLTIDIVKEYWRIVNGILHPKISTFYRLLTGLPVPYTVAPMRLRSLLMKRKIEFDSINFNDKLPLDALRFLLVNSIEEIAHEKLVRKMWNGKHYVCAVTHDIDTYRGLKRAKVLKRLELKYDVPSAWYIPVKHYKLDVGIVRELSNHGEVGAHGTKHDGKLVKLPREKMIDRLCEAKQILENVIKDSIYGFRSPLLQCNAEFIQALNRAGYIYDSSVPTWEPNNPFTMKPYGIGTVNLMEMNGVFEVPLTLPQDHQMLYVLGMTPKQTVESWLKLMDAVGNIGGICTILIHPDYELADSKNLETYEELLNSITAENRALITTLVKLIEKRLEKSAK